MDEHPADALSRYTHLRTQLADVDRRIQAYNLDGHSTHANRMSAEQITEAAALLRQQTSASETFAAAAGALAAALEAD